MSPCRARDMGESAPLPDRERIVTIVGASTRVEATGGIDGTRPMRYKRLPGYGEVIVSEDDWRSCSVVRVAPPIRPRKLAKVPFVELAERRLPRRAAAPGRRPAEQPDGGAVVPALPDRIRPGPGAGAGTGPVRGGGRVGRVRHAPLRGAGALPAEPHHDGPPPRRRADGDADPGGRAHLPGHAAGARLVDSTVDGPARPVGPGSGGARVRARAAVRAPATLAAVAALLRLA
jgi:hypothetical protein